MNEVAPPLSTSEIIDSGLLHVVNERVFWPLGLALSASLPDGHLTIRQYGDEIETGLTPDEHRARHHAFERFEANRRVRFPRSDPPDPIEGDGAPESDEWARRERIVD